MLGKMDKYNVHQDILGTEQDEKWRNVETLHSTYDHLK